MNLLYKPDGDILSPLSGHDLIVIPVNCIGVMGKGLALAFAQQNPKALEHYKSICPMTPGLPAFIIQKDSSIVCLFPTKNHWRNPSQLKWIRDGMRLLATRLPALAILRGQLSVGIPMLGCGLGGLSWPSVLGVVRAELEAVEPCPSVTVTIYGVEV